MLLDRFDPFLAEFDQLAQRALGRSETAGMPMDITRRGDELVLRMDLPGVGADQLTLTCENHLLTIAAERRASYGEDEQVLVQERLDGTVTRRLRLPDFVDTDRVGADLSDGVLTVTLPLAEQAKPRRIEVRSGAGSSGQAQINA